MSASGALEACREALRERDLDALLVAQPENRRYLSGYTAGDNGIQESSGCLLMLREEGEGPFLLTDSRFTLQAGEEAPGFEVIRYKRGVQEALEALLPRLSARRLGFEADYCLFSRWRKLSDMADRLGLELLPAENVVERLRVVKTEAERELLRASSRLNDAVFRRAFETARPGVSERELARFIEGTMLDMGAERPSFETIVAFGENAAKPHAVPGGRRLKEGEPALIDMGLVLNGYCSDMSRTFVLGEPDAAYRERHRLVRAAQKAGIAALRAGVSGKDVDAAARRVLTEAGFGEAFGHGLGHGVGLAVHEAPRLSPSSEDTLAVGMAVTVEPGLYLADWGGIRLENMAIVTEDGCEILNKDETWLDI